MLGIDIGLIFALGVFAFVIVALAVFVGIVIAEALLGFRRHRNSEPTFHFKDK